MIRASAFTSALVCSLALVLVPVERASAQPERQRIVELNRQAMTAYSGLELDTAKSLLEQALALAGRASITNGRELAQTHLNLGVVSIGGFSDNAAGLRHFSAALAADPTITLDRATSTPDIQAIFAQARARGPVAQTGATPQPTSPQPPPEVAATLVHTAVEEQLENHPIPIFVQVPPQMRAVEVILRYRSGGTGLFSSLVMDRVSNGYGMEIPCAAIHSASVQYYVIARDAQQRIVARVATEASPVNVRIVARRSRPVIALPTRSPPEACLASAAPQSPATNPTPATTARPATTTPATTTPEPSQEEAVALRSTGTGIVGDACESSDACGEGLVCEDAVCTQPPAEEAATPSRFFMNIGYSGGFVAVRPGMLADSTVPYDPRTKPDSWNDAINGPYAPPGYTEAEWLNVVALLYPSYVLPEGTTTPGAGDPRLIDAGCDVDPDRYCVRVTQEGVRPIGALRFELGYYIIPRVAVSLDMRTSTHAGRDALARVLFAVRGHVVLTPPRVVGPHVAAIVGGGIGQIQGRVPQGRYEGPDLVRASTGLVYLRSGQKIHEPWTTSGLGHIQLGGALGYHFDERLGIMVEPVLYLMFPRFAFASDTTISLQLTF